MKICHISSGHYSESGRIFNRACRGLVERGHHVTLIINHDKSEEETVEGVRIIPLTIRAGLKRYIFSALEAYLNALEVDADIFHFHDPELLPWMVRLQKKKGRRVVFDSHEHFSAVLGRRLNGRAGAAWFPFVYHRYQKWATDRLSGLIGITNEMIDVINPYARHRCPVGNFVNLSIFNGWKLPEKASPPILATTGIISTARHCDQLVASLPLILERHGELILRLSGQFSPPDYEETLTRLAAEHGVGKHLELLGYVSYRENIERAAQASIGCAFFDPAPHAVVTLQNRLFEYMFCAVPVLITRGCGVMEEIVREEKCGLVVDSTNPESIAEAVCALLDDPMEATKMGEKGRRAVIEKFNFEVALDGMIRFYQDIIAGDRRRR